MNTRQLSAPPRRYPTAPVRPWALVIWLWIPLLAVAGLIAGLHIGELRAGDPGPWKHIAFIVAIAIACTLLLARRSIDLQGDELVLRSALFTRRVPVAAMRLDAARLLDLAEHTGFKPGLRKFGFSYPGFHSGYYRTRDAGAAFYLVTDGQRVLVLPLRDGSWLVISPEQPRQLLEDLRQLAAREA